jgi:multiple sugar transport system permease protein/sn-glycerol 3-phosphate transport system permease protein
LLALAAALVAALPLLYSLLVSFTMPAVAFAGTLLPSEVSWQNYLAAWKAVPFARYFLNSALVALMATSATLFTSILAAYAFARLRFPMQNVLFAIFLATMMIPGHITLIPNYLTVARLGLLDTYWALVLPSVASGFTVFFLRQHMKGVPRELDEAARLDGASSWIILWRVIVPLCIPAIATMGLFNLISEWNAYLWPLIVTDSDATRTVQIGLARLFSRSAEEGLINWPVVLAGSWIVLLPTLGFFLAAERYLSRGVGLSSLLK